MPDARLKRSNTGCMTCRRRKKKCDEIHPVCTGCKKNDISCSWGTVPRKSQRHREHGYNKDFAVPPELGAMVTIFAAPCPSLTRRLISHFIEYSPSWLSPIGGPKRNNFLHHVLSAAMENQLIFDCLLSVAARDLCKMGNDPVELERLSYEYYCVAATNLSTAITDEIESIKSGEGHYSAGMLLSYPRNCLIKPAVPDSEPRLIKILDDTLLAVLLLCVHEVGHRNAILLFSPSELTVPRRSTLAVVIDCSCTSMGQLR